MSPRHMNAQNDGNSSKSELQLLPSDMAGMTISKEPTASTSTSASIQKHAGPPAAYASPSATNIWQFRADQQRIAAEQAEARARERAGERERQEAARMAQLHHQAAWSGQAGGPSVSYRAPGHFQQGHAPPRPLHVNGVHSRQLQHAPHSPHASALHPYSGIPAIHHQLQAGHAHRAPPWQMHHVPKVASAAPLQHTQQELPEDSVARYRILHERNCRPDAGFTGQLNHYIRQVLLPPIVPQQWQTELMEQGRRILEDIVQTVCPGGRLVPFGSLVNDLALRNSDLDLCLVLDGSIPSQPEENDEITPRQILEQLGKLIRNEIPYLYCQYKTHARIPIIKLYARRQMSSGLYGSRWNSFIADISVGNLLAIYNTRLLKAYARIDDRFRYLVLFLKIWTSRRKINEAFHGTLSSYGWSLMALHFLMYGMEPPILPNLQDIERSTETREEDVVDGYDTYFFNDLSRLSDHFTTLNPSSLGTVIRDFFIYYGGVFDFKTDVISIRQRRVQKEDKGWQEDLERDHNHICIEDPFKTDYNVGRVVQNTGFKLIRDELVRAKDILLHSENTHQYIGFTVGKLLEPGQGIVKRRLNIKKEVVVQHGRRTGPPLPPGSEMLANLPVLQSVLKEDDFPSLT